jgi:hypothetical protein
MPSEPRYCGCSGLCASWLQWPDNLAWRFVAGQRLTGYQIGFLYHYDFVGWHSRIPVLSMACRSLGTQGNPRAQPYTPEALSLANTSHRNRLASAIGRIGSLIGPYVIGMILPTAGQAGVFALGAGAFVPAALTVLVLGEETCGRTLERISY